MKPIANGGRNSQAYKRIRAEFKRGLYLCWICNERPGTWVDHYPPLSSFPHSSLWKGEYRPACQRCQSQQGARITNSKRRPQSRIWTF